MAPTTCGGQIYLPIPDSALGTFLGLLFFGGVLGTGYSINCLRKAQQRTAFGVFGMNLMISHLLLLTITPLRIVHLALHGTWLPRHTFCSIMKAFVYMHMYVSIMLLLCLCVYRFIQLGHSFTDNHRSLPHSYAAPLCVVTWLLGISAVIPVYGEMHSSTSPNVTQANMVGGNCFVYTGQARLPFTLHVNAVLVSLFMTSCITMATCWVLLCRHLRSQRGSVEMRALYKVLWMFVVFLFCYAPYHGTILPYLLSNQDAEASCTRRKMFFTVNKICLHLTELSVCLDPLIFFFMARVVKS
uniref:G-protein coupled receptors family 1 profile domain-containing protein n=1 Tax=Eptatretus burgeri TaxID=7764 RepID=A0A8C4WYH3_EPTBU